MMQGGGEGVAFCLRWTLKRCMSQSTLRREGEAKFKGASSKEGKYVGVANNVYSRKMLEKSKRGLRILRIRVRELFTCGEDISTSHVRHKR